MTPAFLRNVRNIRRGRKRLLTLAVDAALCILATLIAFYLRLGEWILPVNVQWLSVTLSLLFALPLFATFGLYRAIIRFAGWPTLVSLARACLLYCVIYSIIFTLIGVPTVPRTIGFIQPLLLFLLIGSSRAFARFWLGGGYEALVNLSDRHRVVIYGAGSAGRQLAAALGSGEEMRVVGFVDDDPTLHGSVLNGHIIHSGENLPKLFERLRATDVLLALPSISRRRRNEIIDIVRESSVGVRTLPGLADIASGRVTVSDLRELDIEDLLGRDQVAPNQVLLSRNITGKTVLVSGAGGSIGSELCRQILQQKPAKLLLLDTSEFALYSIHEELLGRLRDNIELGIQLEPLLGSVADENRMNSILSAWKPDTLYHAAAYKHVPLVEQNPIQGVYNNVWGTMISAQAAARHGVKDFVLISTDKAVRPTSVMGASKRLAEMVLQAMAGTGDHLTRFSMVRFGNVLGSSGSVVPLFREQIARGGPLTITHPEVTRYFMTIPEAAQLVIQACAMADGGEVFVLDMGEPVKIMDLARNMIELSGASVLDANNPDGEIAIQVTGLRPGEKLFEELLIGNEPTGTAHSKILKAREDYMPWPELQSLLEAFLGYMQGNDVEALRTRVIAIAAEYTRCDVADPND